MTPIGFDLGHSAVKISVHHDAQQHQIMIPSVVIPGFHISDDAERQRAQQDTVELYDTDIKGFKSYFVGETAIAQDANVATGLHSDWIHSPEYAALLLAGHHKLINLGIEPHDQLLVMGLPVLNFTEARDQLTPIVKALLPAVQFKILMQPVYPLQTIMLDEQGNPFPGRSLKEESWAVIDIGYFTTDIISIEHERFATPRSGTCRGVSRCCETLISILEQRGIKSVTMDEAQESLRTNKIRLYNRNEDITEECDKAREVLSLEVISMATRLLADSARRRTGVLLTGGGAPILYEQLRAMWPNTEMSPLGRFAVAEGMRRLGSYFVNQSTANS